MSPTCDRIIDVGSAGFHPPSAMESGMTHPDSGVELLYGQQTTTNQVIAEPARQLYTRKKPTIYPGPLYLWAWHADWVFTLSIVSLTMLLLLELVQEFK